MSLLVATIGTKAGSATGGGLNGALMISSSVSSDIVSFAGAAEIVKLKRAKMVRLLRDTMLSS